MHCSSIVCVWTSLSIQCLVLSAMWRNKTLKESFINILFYRLRKIPRIFCTEIHKCILFWILFEKRREVHRHSSANQAGTQAHSCYLLRDVLFINSWVVYFTYATPCCHSQLKHNIMWNIMLTTVIHYNTRK